MVISHNDDDKDTQRILLSDQPTWAWMSWCRCWTRWSWPPRWWRPPTARSTTRAGRAFAESASESWFRLSSLLLHSYNWTFQTLFFYKENVVSHYYRFPETTSCTFEEQEIQAIFQYFNLIQYFNISIFQLDVIDVSKFNSGSLFWSKCHLLWQSNLS